MSLASVVFALGLTAPEAQAAAPGRIVRARRRDPKPSVA
jgi:hypothetical protein